MEYCRVSIGMPVYNDVKFLPRALNSILAQTFTDFELIISDDASTDGSERVCKRFEKMDSRIKYIRQEKNIGISRNMEFLIRNAKGKYFMWAGNDDIWDASFIEILINGFENSINVVSVFCPMAFIDEEDNIITDYSIRATDYSGNTAFARLKKLIKIFDDGFGYGLFCRDQIKEVKFPVWWWVNKKCAYNNIYPTLCYYLALGDFKLTGVKPLWFNRLKKEKDINHKIPYNHTFLRGWLSFSLRKLNLVLVSLQNILAAKGSLNTCYKIAPFMFFYWFIIPSYNEFRQRFIGILKGNVSFW